jgi:hypothetical protein
LARDGNAGANSCQRKNRQQRGRDHRFHFAHFLLVAYFLYVLSSGLQVMRSANFQRRLLIFRPKPRLYLAARVTDMERESRLTWRLSLS